MTGNVPGVHTDGCCIVLCQGTGCRLASPTAGADLWPVLRRALGRVVTRIPRSVLVTTDCLGQCRGRQRGIHVVTRTRDHETAPATAQTVVSDRADAALLCAALLRANGHRPQGYSQHHGR